jgi:hypothetical protein
MKIREFENMINEMLDVSERYILHKRDDYELGLVDRISEVLWDNLEQLLVTEDDRCYN